MIHSKKSSTRALTVCLIAIGLAALHGVAPVAQAQDAGAQSAKPKPCSDPEYRAFDFWVGEWDVWTERLRQGGGTPAKSKITLVEGGCVVQEEYSTSQGYSGRSLNWFDKRDGKWHQAWIDNQGAPIIQVGGMQGESMVLEAAGAEGARDRITWTPMEGGKVRQHWTRTKDGGKSWATVFDGMYHPRAE